jgi:hypothetical protein
LGSKNGLMYRATTWGIIADNSGNFEDIKRLHINADPTLEMFGKLSSVGLILNLLYFLFFNAVRLVYSLFSSLYRLLLLILIVLLAILDRLNTLNLNKNRKFTIRKLLFGYFFLSLVILFRCLNFKIRAFCERPLNLFLVNLLTVVSIK